MKVIKTKDLEGTERDVEYNGGRSVRILLEKDNMGFSLHRTLVKKGTYNWHYKNHLEACYCVYGKGIIKDLNTNESYEVSPDSTYVLDNHDNHEFTAIEDTILISVFNPPIVGTETHQEDGSYKLITKK